jgi:RNA polymerase sigma-70 factor (ECF subfamily)
MVAILQTAGVPTQAEFHEAISSRSDRWFAACLKITRNRDMAEDAVQDALLSAWNKRHQFDNSARLETWIHRIAVNAALQLLRKQRPAAFEPLESDVEDTTGTPEDATANQQLGQTLSSAMVQLSDFERICFVLKHLEQWRLREIAEETGTDVGAVKQGVFRAVRKLRTRMGSLKGKQP